MSEGDNLAVLRLMRREGQITNAEYENLTRGLGASTEAPIPAEGEVVAPKAVEETSEDNIPLWPPRIREGLSPNYVTGLAIAAIVLALVGGLGWASWYVTLPAMALLVTTLLDGWQLVTGVGALVWIGILVLSLTSSFTADPQPQPAVVITLPPSDPHPEIPGSLDVYMDQVPDAWNAVESDARIVKGLTRHNETGDYDTFIYRFGDWGRLVGAYDPTNEMIYALLATGQFRSPATDMLYIHLCSVVEPFSPECLDSFTERGLDGGTLSDFDGVTHEAEWKLGEDTWRLQLDQNVLEIRVFGADAA